MAANPLIALQAKVPDVGQAFSNVLTNLGNIEKLRQAPARQQLLEAQTAQAQADVPTEQEIRFKSVVNAAVDLNRLPTDADKLTFAKNRRAQLLEAGKETGAPVNTEETDLYISKLESGDTVGAQALLDNTINAGRQMGIVGAATGTTGLASAKTEILESGATIQALPTGETVVRDPSGKIAQGEERLDVLKEAQTQVQEKRQREADVTVSTAKRVEQVKKATQTADKAFGMVENLRQNISNLKEVVPLIGQGANTGPIVQMFPSVKAATVKLENLQKRLSLDVVGAVTFGALSKGELDLAKAVAIPLGLEGDELIKWTNDTIAAKEKLANYFEEQAIFLGQGNTQADWLKLKKDELKATIGDATEADIRRTMKDNNMTRPQVIEELKRRRLSGGA
jgi:hypothetical protein